MSEVRLIDANALIKDIAESLRFAEEWEKEAHEKEDEHGVKCAIETRRSLLAMISRIEEAPTIESELMRKPEMSDADRKKCEEWCKDCEHIEMCAWYPFGGCDFRLLSKPEQEVSEDAEM